MATVTHKRDCQPQTTFVSVWCPARMVLLAESCWFWKHVTCKNCLKLRPKGKR